MPSLVDRWRRWRDQLQANPKFQHWAAGFPLTRWIARRRARALFDLVGGFVYSQVLLACVQLRLFDLLADGPLNEAQLARGLSLPLLATRRLVLAAVALRLLERRGEAYGLGPLGAPMVGNQAIAAMVEHHIALYADLRDPVALLRGESAAGALAQYWPYATGNTPDALLQERVATYSGLMSASQPLVANEILDAYSLQQHKCLLDVGGGEGTFLLAVAQRVPQLRLQLFDLPAVAARAMSRFAAAGLADRSSAHGGDFAHDELPRGADIATLVRVIHDHDDERAMAILRAVHRALPNGGVVLLAEPMAQTPGAETMGDAYFGFYLLAMGSGRPRTQAELTAMLVDAGFTKVRALPTRMPLQTSVLQAIAVHN
jgi:demethylspheroidene O-methyltransferase